MVLRRSPALPVLLGLALVVTACSSSTDDTAASTTGPTTTEAGETTTVPAGEATTTAPPSTTETETETTEPTVPLTCGVPRVGSVMSTSLDAGGADHPVRILVPEAATDATTLPVVLNWHGLGSNGDQQAAFTLYEELAAAEGFIVVHATGVPSGDDDRNAWEVGPFDDPDKDDLAFADALIDQLIDDHCADPDRIYSTGMSNGGFFTARLICERADRIAAAVSVAATSFPADCDPAEPVPYLAYHGTADAVVSFDGGGSTLVTDAAAATASEAELAFFEQRMLDEFGEFADAFGCIGIGPEQIAGDVIEHAFDGCDDGVRLAFYEIIDGGHTWPNSPLGPFLEDQLGRTTTSVDATVEGWAFMSAFTN